LIDADPAVLDLLPPDIDRDEAKGELELGQAVTTCAPATASPLQCTSACRRVLELGPAGSASGAATNHGWVVITTPAMAWASDRDWVLGWLIMAEPPAWERADYLVWADSARYSLKGLGPRH
jgi:hypothetical protein